MLSEDELTAGIERRRRLLAETEGLVPSPLPSPMLQPWEVFDQDLFDLEMLRVFGRSWVWLGDTEDLAEPGDYLTASIGYQSVLVVRTPDGSIKGFLNSCRHRASPVLSEPSGHCKSSMTCPYHNWSYDLDGRLIGIPDRQRMYPDGIPTGEYGLVPIRIEVAWDKLVFGCLSHRAPPFSEWIAPHRRALRPLPVRHLQPLPPPARPDLPDQLEGVRRELQRRLPRPLRPSAPERRAPVVGHDRALLRTHL